MNALPDGCAVILEWAEDGSLVIEVPDAEENPGLAARLLRSLAADLELSARGPLH